MSEEKKRLIIIDSNSVIHRAYHALPPLATKKKELVNAVYGFLLVLFRAIREFQPDYIAATFDLPLPTFRHQKFKEYKAKRPPTPKELSQQIPLVKEILNVFNIPVFEKEGFEADDLIGTIVELSSKEPGLETIILSGDLDTLQLVDSHTRVYALRKGVKDTILYDICQVEKKYGILPSQLLDFKALRGDPSDNIPGVTGIGEKTAVKLIKQFGTLGDLYKVLSQQPLLKALLININQRLQENLIKHKEHAFLSRDLAQIKKDVPIDFNFEKCHWEEYNREKAAQLLKKFEFYSLIEKLPDSQSKDHLKENLRLW